MIKKLLLTLGAIILSCTIALSQSSIIKGVVLDQAGNPLEYSNVYLKQEDKVVNMAMSNEKGEYQLFGVSSGTYDVEAEAMTCKKKVKQTGVTVSSGQTRFLDFEINCSTNLDVVEVVWTPPVFEKDNVQVVSRLGGDEVRKTPGRSIGAALANLEGVTAVDGSMTSVRGNRSDGQQMIIDGVRVRGGSSVSMSSIEEAQLLQGGIPAELGDGTSFTIITTKPASKDFHGSAEVRGSLEGYNNFLAAASLSGPILKAKRSSDPARIGFFLAGEMSYDKDNYPAQGGTWRANDDVIDNLIKNPIRYDSEEFGSWYNEASYLTSESFYKQRVRDNAGQWNYLLQGKLDFMAGQKSNIRISLGGSYQYFKGKNWGTSSALFNAQNNSESMQSTLRLNARLNHRILVGESKVLKNVMYDINVNYTRVNALTQDSRHKDNFFNYGYMGKFKTYKVENYTFGDVTIDSVLYYDMYVLDNIYDSMVTFEAGSANPDLIYYTQNFIDNFSPDVINDYYGTTIPYNLDLYSQFGALINGTSPSGVYSLYSSPGSIYGSYSKSQQEQLGFKASLSMNLNDNELKLGYEFEKLTTRGFSVAPVSLWTLMRDKTNSHITQLDLENPIFIGQDTVYYNRLVSDAQSNFDRSIRNKIGAAEDEWIDIDNMDPSTFSLGMFSAEELLVGTSGSLVGYYGYDYTGENVYKKKTSITDFFNHRDENGNKTYQIGAYEPIYMAMYIQDKFSINTLLFSVGVRIDRFDANQSVLKDPFLFKDALTVGDFASEMRSNFVSNASNDWVVYVNEKDNTLSSDFSADNILGYRSGTTWYDAEGKEVSDPESLLGANGGPILKEGLDMTDVAPRVGADAFEDYTPQWSVMPRISFSFPVSDVSLFYASYNIITTRPTNLQLDPVSYLFIEKFGSNSSNVVSNPNLKPQKSIDYEIGFRQKVGDKSAISIRAYYSEKRDMIQSYRYSGAYPSTYYSYANMDFGTVQGFSFSYNLSRLKNISLRASYTLQFAKGTGSSSSSNLAIISSGQPNLRTLTNLSFDQRHRIAGSIDYRFDGGAEYNGPKSEKVVKGTNTKKTIRWFENTGITLLLSAASGEPYTRSSTPFSALGLGGQSRTSGSINGSHKPWIFQCDLRIDRTWILNLTKEGAKDKKGNEKGRKTGMVTVYLDVQNLFNFKNILSVYTYTGNPDDDGYLSAAEYQQQINSQVYVPSFVNYYQMMIQNPYNYSMPTRVSLGVQFQF